MRSILKLLYPDLCLAHYSQVDPAFLRTLGKKAVMFDIDGTLTVQDAPADADNIRYFARLREAGIRTLVLSNNHDPKRPERFAEQVGCLAVGAAAKPSVKGYRKALKLLGVRPEETVFVGDQLFTDVLGANLSGIYSIFVTPIEPEKETLSVRLKRPLEKPVFALYRRNLRRAEGKSNEKE